MSHNWILDVLADLKAYAVKNDLVALAEQLDDTRHVTVAELLARGGGSVLDPRVNGGKPFRVANDKRVGGSV